MPVRVISVAASHRPDLVRIEFVTLSGENGEAHVSPQTELSLMASYDFEEEEW